MAQGLKWYDLLTNEDALLSVLVGEVDLPPFSGNLTSVRGRMYQSLGAVMLLLHGDYEQAAEILAKLRDPYPSLRLSELAQIWLKGEQESPEEACKLLDAWFDEGHPAIQNGRMVYGTTMQILELDRSLAVRWAPILRMYLTSLLDEWPENVMARFQHDLETVVKSGIPTEIITRITFMLRMARVRKERDVLALLDAVEEWQTLCEQNPSLGNGTEYLLDAIIALEFDNRFTEALTLTEKALDLQPGQYDLLLVKARILKRLGDSSVSMQVCNELISRFPEDYSGYCLRSNAYFLQDEYDLAMADAQKACDIAPENPNGYLARAFVFMHMNQYDEALADFEQVVKRDPANYDGLRGKAKCLSMLGRDFDALSAFNSLRRDYPEDPDLYYELADVLFSTGYLEDCEKMCRRCLQMDNAYANAYVILGMIAVRRGEDDLAHGLLSRAVKLEPDNPFALNELAYLTHLEGDDELALDLVNRALLESDDYADAICNKGVILFYRSEFEQAAAAFSQTVRLMPDHVSAWVGWGNTLTQLCEFDEAQKCYDKALQLDPASADACHGKAMLYRMLGLDDEVRRWQERALQLDPDIEDD